MTNPLFQQIRDRIGTAADQIFLETPGASSLTFADLLAQSARVASALVAHGVSPGDRVAALAEKSPEALLLYLGTIRAGAIFLPLNPAFTDAELAYFLADAVPRLVVCDPARRDSLAEVATKANVAALLTLGADGRGSLTDAAAAASAEFADVARAPDDLAAILYTSGTTGRAKGAMLTHANLASNAESLAALWRLTSSDVLLHALPIYHTHGLFVAVNTLLFAAGRIIFLPRFDADECLRLMPRATVMMGVPTFYTRLLRHEGLTREACAAMRLFVSGSAPLLAESHRDWRERTGHAILERYGMTETNMTTSNPYDGERLAGSVGFPLPGVDLRITEPETAAILPRGEIGVIEVKGPNVFKGYWRNPEKTAAEFRPDGFFITGDLGRIDARGYVHIIGRATDLIITGGENVYPKEVEAEIDGLPGVVESAVVALPHADFGEAVTAFVVRAAGARLSEEDVRAAVERRLAKFKAPKRVIFLDELPRNAMGKVQKNVLRQAHRDLYAPSP
ncbi:malonate--CoA ligase [Methylocapsa acidiphila]|uniref:malonate--CoA ligase n=1 Tax=Methylocapsa acidiphila TaxID=133552 RepID=UPI000429262B|nr:malonyl-CoA synthase [Methylocapsa acidiphila]